MNRLRSIALVLALIPLGVSAVPAKDKGNDGNNGNAYGQDNGNNGQSNENNGNAYGKDKNADGPTTPGDSSGNSPPGQVNQTTVVQPADQDIALDAVERARALPLEEITARVRAETSGDVIDARLITVGGFLLYEVKVLEGDRLEVLYYYAKSGTQVQR